MYIVHEVPRLDEVNESIAPVEKAQVDARLVFDLWEQPRNSLSKSSSTSVLGGTPSQLGRRACPPTVCILRPCS